jgi:hypothetical protein
MLLEGMEALGQLVCRLVKGLSSVNAHLRLAKKAKKYSFSSSSCSLSSFLFSFITEE